jgi:MYXO-CTERM domain-containing protein
MLHLGLRTHASRALLFALAAGAAVLTVDAPDARACGGCFHQPLDVNTSLVTQHRMVFSVSTTQTVLWDQIQYAGSPKDFAWVLPVKPGAVVELSQDAWISALEANTQTVVVGPSTSCGGAPVEDIGGNGGGCGLGSASEVNYAAGASADAGSAQDSGVDVVTQEVVGPYDAVTVRASQGEALGTWLRANGYDVSVAVQPVIDAFAAAGFDFIALKLAPGEGVRAMQPVRVVTPGSDATLPLRMVAAGTGTHVGIDLYVLSEGRYHTQNFPDVSVDFSQLAWDPTQQRSNYTELADAALASGGGTGWLTSYAGPADLYGNGNVGGGGSAPPNPGLLSAYQGACRTTPPQTICPPPDAGSGGEAGDATDGGAADAASDGASAEASADAGSGDDGGNGCTTVPGLMCDDLDLAMTGVHAGSLWITRLHADLPQSALRVDLVIEAAPQQDTVQNVHTTSKYTVANYNPCPNGNNNSTPAANSTGGCACRTAESPANRYQTALALCLGGAFLGFAVRRRRRK